MCDVHAVSFNQFAHRLNSHLSGEPGLAGCPFMSLLHFLRDCILPGQTKSFHILLDTISPCLPWMSPWFCTFHFHHCATFNLVSIILAIHMSKLSHLPFLITKLTGSNPNSSVNSAFFSLFNIPYLILVTFVRVSCIKSSFTSGRKSL